MIYVVVVIITWKIIFIWVLLKGRMSKTKKERKFINTINKTRFCFRKTFFSSLFCLLKLHFTAYAFPFLSPRTNRSFFFSSSTSSSAVRNNEWRKYLFLRCYFYEIFVVFWFYFFGFSSRTETANEFNWDIQNAIYSIETVISFALIGFRFPFMEFIKYFFRKHLFTKKKKEIFTRCST